MGGGLAPVPLLVGSNIRVPVSKYPGATRRFSMSSLSSMPFPQSRSSFSASFCCVCMCEIRFWQELITAAGEVEKVPEGETI